MSELQREDNIKIAIGRMCEKQTRPDLNIIKDKLPRNRKLKSPTNETDEALNKIITLSENIFTELGNSISQNINIPSASTSSTGWIIKRANNKRFDPAENFFGVKENIAPKNSNMELKATEQKRKIQIEDETRNNPLTETPKKSASRLLTPNNLEDETKMTENERQLEIKIKMIIWYFQYQYTKATTERISEYMTLLFGDDFSLEQILKKLCDENVLYQNYYNDGGFSYGISNDEQPTNEKNISSRRHLTIYSKPVTTRTRAKVIKNVNANTPEDSARRSEYKKRAGFISWFSDYSWMPKENYDMVKIKLIK